MILRVCSNSRALGLLVLAFFAGSLRAAEWRQTTWEGEPAWRADSGGWRAVVSPARGRLVQLGRKDAPGVLAREGHRFWLGPQTEWPAWWPPPAAWESRPAASVRVEGDTLVLVAFPTGVGGWPDVERRYRWDGENRLVCEGIWRGGSVPVQGMHILQLPTEAVVTVRPGREGILALPVWERRTHVPDPELPPELLEPVADGTKRMRSIGREHKLGFWTQPLVARVGDTEVTLSARPTDFAPVGEPDYGYNAQVFVGNADVPGVEIEQMSARAAPGPEPRRFAIEIGLRKVGTPADAAVPAR